MSIQSLITAAIATGVLAGSSQAITIYGLGAGGQLYRFDSAAPGVVSAVGSGTAGGIVDIDFRGSNNQLYGLTSTGATSTINTTSGAVSPALFSPNNTITGGVSGFDFNPTADRMRLIGGGINNFRVVPDGIAGMTAGTVPNGAAGDGLYNVPSGVSLLDVAYTSPFSRLATTLFSIGSDGSLYRHTTPAGTFSDATFVGSLGLVSPLSSDIGFDIDDNGLGYLVTGNSLFTVDLATGLASSAGTIGQALTSIAVVPEPSAALLSGLAGLGLLRRRRTA